MLEQKERSPSRAITEPQSPPIEKPSSSTPDTKEPISDKKQESSSSFKYYMVCYPRLFVLSRVH
jgi:hypothetical protein